MLKRSRVNHELASQSWRKPKKNELGQALCRWCQSPVTAPRRRTFCSDPCVHEFKLQTNPGYLRQKTFERDRGVCAVCGCDTLKIARVVHAFQRIEVPRNPPLVPMPCWNGDLSTRDQYRADLKARQAATPRWAGYSGWCRERDTYLAAIGFVQRNGNVDQRVIDRRDAGWLWAADHILAVVEGGGCCGLDNIRTLCWPCHREASAELAARRATERRAAKAGLPANPAPLSCEAPGA